MVDFKNFSAILSCLDDYMVDKGKKEINDMEANMEPGPCRFVEGLSAQSGFSSQGFAYEIERRQSLAAEHTPEVWHVDH